MVIVLVKLLTKKSLEWSNIEIGLLIFFILFGAISFGILSLQVSKLINQKVKGFKADIISISINGLLLLVGIAFILGTLVFFNQEKGLAQEVDEVKGVETKKVEASTYNLISSGLKFGATGRKVSLIQSAFSSDSSIYPLGNISGYYGEETKEAVMKFQKKYYLEQTGEIDEKTAKKFNEIYGTQSEDYYLNKFPTPTKIIVNNNYFDPDPVISCNVHVSCGGGTRQLRKSICDQSVCCQVGNTWLFYESKSKCTEDQNFTNEQGASNNYSNNYTNQTNYETVKIPCSYSSGQFQYNFGELTYNECKVKTDEYWAKERQKISDSSLTNYPTSIPPTQAGKSQADIDKCKNEVRAKYEDLIRGCYIITQDSAANVCARGYQDQSGTAMQQCY